ncbi:MAG: CRISPR-associated endonuclease Cas2 [Candidatus Entotheonellia bacterium]
METHVVAYDIRDPKRLRRVAKTCLDFGCRRQLSVFLCRITATDLVRLRTRLEDIIEPKEDQVLFIRLCGAYAVDIEAIGIPTLAHDAQDVVIVS